MAGTGFAVEVLCGTIVDAGGNGRDPATVLAELGIEVHEEHAVVWTVSAGAGPSGFDRPLKAVVDDVPLTTHRMPIRFYHDPDLREVVEFLRLFDERVEAFRPDVLLTYGGDPLTRAILARARDLGIATVFHLHNFFYHDPALFRDVDAVLVPSRFSADYYRRTLGLDCVVIPYVVDFERVHVDQPQPKYLTLVNPSIEKGVFPFARIADELGRRRPDIPILVVESRGTEWTLVSCGVDLREHGNVFLMAQTPDPRRFWRVTKCLLMPSLFLESQGLAAVEAMANGIPAVASDRGALPETLGAAGAVLPLPERLTPFSHELPTPEEVQPRVEALIRLTCIRSSNASASTRPGAGLPRP